MTEPEEEVLAKLFADIGEAFDGIGFACRDLAVAFEAASAALTPATPPTPAQWPTDGRLVTSGLHDFDGHVDQANITGLDDHSRYYRFLGGALTATTPIGDEPGAPALTLIKQRNGRVWIERLLTAQGRDTAATSHQDQHITFPGDIKVRLTQEFYFVDTKNYPWDWGKTLKIGGLVGFNEKNWSKWPGGHKGGAANSSVRTVVNRWFKGDTLPDNPPDPKVAMYVYMGGRADTFTGPPPIYTADNVEGMTAQWDLDFIPPVNRWIQITKTLTANTPGKPDGTMEVHARVADADGIYRDPLLGEPILSVAGLPYFDKGPGLWNRYYQSVMFGGSQVDYAPHNEARGGWIGVGGHRTHTLD